MAKRDRRFRRVVNEGFTCGRCGARVFPLAGGSCRNHCPRCLWSKHVDDVPGDRASPCGGMMECVAVESDARRGWMMVHRCVRCGVVRRNKAALSDPAQPDSIAALVEVQARAVGTGPRG